MDDDDNDEEGKDDDDVDDDDDEFDRGEADTQLETGSDGRVPRQHGHDAADRPHLHDILELILHVPQGDSD